MKKFLPTLLLATVASFGFAQNFTPVTYDSTFYGAPTDSDFYGYIHVNNDLGSSQALYWEVDSVNLPPQWEFSVCDQSICHPIGTVEADWTLPFSQGYLNMHFYPNNQEGEGLVIIRVFDTPNMEQVEFLTFRANAISQAGIEEEVGNNGVKVYPNPTTDKFIVSGNLANSPFILIDVQGNVVQEGVINDESYLSLSNQSKGVYFLRVKLDGSVVTRKIIKK